MTDSLVIKFANYIHSISRSNDTVEPAEHVIKKRN